MSMPNDLRSLTQKVEDVIYCISPNKLEKIQMKDLEQLVRKEGVLVTNEVRKRIKRVRHHAVQALLKARRDDRSNTKDTITQAIQFAGNTLVEVEQPKVQQPKVEQPKVEQPKVEQPKVEQPKVEQPKVEQPKVEQPKVKSTQSIESNQEFLTAFQFFSQYLAEMNEKRALKICVEELARELTPLGYDFSDDSMFWRLKQALVKFKNERGKTFRSRNPPVPWQDLPDSEAKRNAQKKLENKARRKSLISELVNSKSYDELLTPCWDDMYDALRKHGIRTTDGLAKEVQRAVEQRLWELPKPEPKVEAVKPKILEEKQEVKITNLSDNDKQFEKLLEDALVLCDGDIDILEIRLSEQVENLRKILVLMQRLKNKIA